MCPAVLAALALVPNHPGIYAAGFAARLPTAIRLADGNTEAVAMALRALELYRAQAAAAAWPLANWRHSAFVPAPGDLQPLSMPTEEHRAPMQVSHLLAPAAPARIAAVPSAMAVMAAGLAHIADEATLHLSALAAAERRLRAGDPSARPALPPGSEPTAGELARDQADGWDPTMRPSPPIVAASLTEVNPDALADLVGLFGEDDTDAICARATEAATYARRLTLFTALAVSQAALKASAAAATAGDLFRSNTSAERDDAQRVIDLSRQAPAPAPQSPASLSAAFEAEHPTIAVAPPEAVAVAAVGIAEPSGVDAAEGAVAEPSGVDAAEGAVAEPSEADAAASIAESPEADAEASIAEPPEADAAASIAESPEPNAAADIAAPPEDDPVTDMTELSDPDATLHTAREPIEGEAAVGFAQPARPAVLPVRDSDIMTELSEPDATLHTARGRSRERRRWASPSLLDPQFCPCATRTS